VVLVILLIPCQATEEVQPKDIASLAAALKSAAAAANASPQGSHVLPAYAPFLNGICWGVSSG
jgi:hypothetical protein